VASPVAFASLLDAALYYAARGWPVFPCSPKNKRPLLAKDKDPATGAAIRGTGGVSKATTDVETITAWWRKWPHAMIGVSVGRAGMIVIDFDPRIEEICDDDTGEVVDVREFTLEDLKAELEAQMGCALPVGLAVRTPSGGVHVYYRMPEGAPIGNRGNLPQHIDVRGKGGYVVVPPSICDGDEKNAAGPYRWLRGNADAPVIELPEQLVEILRSQAARPMAAEQAQAPRILGEPRFTPDLDQAHRSYALRALDEELRELETTPEGGGRWGGRNAGIYHAALKLGGFVLAGALSEAMVRGGIEAVVRAMPNNRDLPGALKAIDNGFENATPRDLGGVGSKSRERMARGRDSGQSASSPPPSAPPEAYSGDADTFRPPDPRQGEEKKASEGFHSGSVSPGNAEGVRGRITAEPDDARDPICAFFSLTDLGNAERFRARHGWRFRFCNELGWFIWDDRRWELLSEEKDKVPGPVSLAVYATIRAIRNEAEVVRDSGLRPDSGGEEGGLDFVAAWKGSGDNKVAVLYSELLAQHAKASESAGRMGCIANLAKAFGELAIRADAMDQDRMAINVLNGTLRLTQAGKRWVSVEGVLKPITTGARWGAVLHPHRPEDLISKIANVVFDPSAACADYDGFLDVVQPDAKMRRFLHQWGGLSLTGDIGEQKLAFFHGKGRNGKSTLVDAWAHVAGDYGGSVGIETFLDQGKGRKGGDATPDLARLPGIRFLRTSEPEKGAKLAEALIKLITGGEEITARYLNKGFFTFLPSFKVTVSGNHKPKITGHDDGIWRRVMLVPWEVQIAIEDIDRDLPAKLRKEGSGLFNRMLEGLLDWRENGLIEPESVIAATAKYREQSDQLGRFLTDCTVVEDGKKTKSSVLLAVFNAWCKATGAAEWQPVGFSRAMEDRGFEKKQSDGMQWLDIRLTKSVADFAEATGDADGSRPSAPDDAYDRGSGPPRQWDDDDTPF